MGDRTVTSPKHSADIPTPYYPIVFTPELPGEYAVRTEHEGQELTASFVAADRAEICLVQVGEPIRPVDTPTFDECPEGGGTDMHSGA